MGARYQVMLLILGLGFVVLNGCATADRHSRVDTIQNVSSGEVHSGVTLFIHHRQSGPRDEPGLLIVNDTDGPVFFGSYYTIERYQDGQWDAVPPPADHAWVDVLYCLGTGDELTQRMWPLPTEPGRYRVVKEYFHECDVGAQPHDASAEFEIKR